MPVYAKMNTMTASLGREAAELLAASDDHPDHVAERGPELATHARTVNDLASAATALQAAGVAERRLGRDVRSSLDHLQKAVDIAVETGDDDLVAGILVSLAMSLAWSGAIDRALATLDRAERLLKPPDRGRAFAQRATILQKRGEAEAALTTYADALDLLESAADHLWIAHILANRGLARSYKGEARGAVADLERACRIYEELGKGYQLAVNTHNLGFAVGRGGDLPRALHLFEQAAQEFEALNIPLAELPLDRAEVLLAAGLAGEAQQIAASVAAELETSGLHADAAEARLLEGQAALLAGDPDAAVTTAGQASEMFTNQKRETWAALADYVALAAKVRLGEGGSTVVVDEARRIAPKLERGGQAAAATHVELICGQQALHSGDLGAAERHLRRVGRLRGSLPLEVRVQAWHARSLLHLANGDRPKALRAARGGVQMANEYRRVLGATDLRAGVSLHLQDLAGHGLRMALDHGRPNHVLHWMDLVRGNSTQLRPARTGAAELPELDELRVLQADLRAALPTEAAELQRRQARLERSIQRRDRTRRGARPKRAAAGIGHLRARLGSDRVLVEMAEVDGSLVAVVIGAGRNDIIEVGAMAPIAAAARKQRRAIDWILDQRSPDDRWLARERDASCQLDELVLKPLRIDSAEVIFVPPTGLFRLAWTRLPSLTERAITLAPSASLWLRGTSSPKGGSGPVVVSGPGLELAEDELDAVCAAHEAGARRLGGGDATVKAVLNAAAETDVLHLAAHGHLPAGNGMFAGVDLHDGRLMVYDIERLSQAPRLVIMSACEGGSADHRPGEEFLGLVAGFLASGTSNLIAATGSIPDASFVVDLMGRLHEGLAVGLTPPVALAQAQQTLTCHGPKAEITAASFICFGADVSGSGC